MKVMLSIFWSVYVPTLPAGNELWLETERYERCKHPKGCLGSALEAG